MDFNIRKTSSNRTGLLFTLLLVLSCASSSSSDQLQIRELIADKNFSKAGEVLESSELKKNPNNQMLYFMEAGSIAFYAAQYSKAAELWQKAIELAANRYTKLSQATTSSVVSDNLKDFAPKEYEVSYLYYYQAMAFYLEYQKTKDRNVLMQARAAIIAWDVYLKSIQIDKEFKNLYFDDYFARFFAGLVHESVGERSDQEIALQLYKDAYQLFLLQGPTYTQFNDKAWDYIQELMKKLQSKEKWREQLSDLAKRNIKIENKKFQSLRQLMASKVIAMTHAIRPRDSKKITKEMDIENSVEGNVLVLWHQGWVSPLKAKAVKLSISAASRDGSATQAVLTAVTQAGFLIFAYKVLGSGPSSSGGNNSSVHVGVNWYGTGDITEPVADMAALEFEVPDVIAPVNSDPPILKIHSTSGKELWNQEGILGQSLSEIIFQTNEREKAKHLMKKGARFAAKHVAAMVGAYAMYQGMVAQSQNNEGLAKLAAMATYFGSARLINLSERADVRFWASLPSSVYLSLIKVPKDEKEIEITKPDGSAQRYSLGLDFTKLQILPVF